MLLPRSEPWRRRLVPLNSDAVWVELSGELVVCRLRGVLSAEDIELARQQVLLLLQETDRKRVLYDTLEMTAPDLGLIEAQRGVSGELRAKGAKIAILVPNTKIAYLSRLAFGEGDYRVVYGDLAEAVRWLLEA